MKALSIWQPWASLIEMGLKRFETRSWPTNYRGPLVICSARKQLSQDALRKLRGGWGAGGCWREPPSEVWRYFGNNDGAYTHNTYRDLPFGRALCVVDLTRVYTTDFTLLASWSGCWQEGLSDDEADLERVFGDFTPDRFAWKLENVRPFKEPFPVRGRQGLFDVDDELVKEALAGLASEGRVNVPQLEVVGGETLSTSSPTTQDT